MIARIEDGCIPAWAMEFADNIFGNFRAHQQCGDLLAFIDSKDAILDVAADVRDFVIDRIYRSALLAAGQTDQQVLPIAALAGCWEKMRDPRTANDEVRLETKRQKLMRLHEKR